MKPLPYVCFTTLSMAVEAPVNLSMASQAEVGRKLKTTETPSKSNV